MAALLTLFRHASQTASPATDAELIDRFTAGRDEDAFAEIVRRHGPVVYRVCRRLVGPGAADDAFQAAFLVLATRLPAARAAGSIGGWLVGVAGRVARQMRRAAGRRARHESAAAATNESDFPDPPLDLADQFRVLDEELARLPDRLRDPVVLCLLQGRTQEEAAAELGRDARTLRRRLERAKQVLRARLERRGVIPAVAAALVAGAGSATASLPNHLCDRTVATVFDFLTGGRAYAQTAPVVLANGVATTMLARKVMRLMAMAAFGLVGFGVVLAGEEPAKPTPTPNPRTSTLLVESARTAKAGERQFLIQAMCIEAPYGFRQDCGIGDEEPSSGFGAWTLTRREAKMFNGLIRAKMAEGKLDILSRPQIQVTEGQAGFMQVGQEVPIAAFESDQKDGKVIKKAEGDSRFVGVTLRATPRLSADGKFIHVLVDTQQSRESPTRVNLGNGLTAPAFNIQTLSSTVMFVDGGTVVMSGMVTKTNDVKTETLWVLTTHIVRGEGEKPAKAPEPSPLIPMSAPGVGVVPVMPQPILLPAPKPVRP